MLSKQFNTNIAYPFLANADLTGIQSSIKSCRICLLAKPSFSAPIQVFLNNISQTGTVTFRIHAIEPKQEQASDSVQDQFITWSKEHGWQNTLWSTPQSYITPICSYGRKNILIPQNSFVELNQNIISGSSNARLLNQCVVQVTSGVHLTLASADKAHTKAGIFAQNTFYGLNIQDNQTQQITELTLESGYNCDVYISNGKLILNCSQGAGTGKPQGYKQWEQYTIGKYQKMSQEEIVNLTHGVYSINGQLEQITFDTKASVSMNMYSQTQDDNSILNLQIGATKNEAL